MKGTEITTQIVMMVVVFVFVLLLFWNVFGSPKCNDLASVTAEQLRIGINDVAENYESYTGDGVPNDPGVYVEKQISLCQQHSFYSYTQSFMGGFPEYQIYYEQFPEGFFNGGAWMWTENYPWSGGAASSLFFWGGLRLGTAAARGIKYVAFAKVKMGLSATTTIHRILKERSSFIQILKNSKKTMNMIDNNPALKIAYKEFKQSGKAEEFISIMGKADAFNALESMKLSGWLAEDAQEVLFSPAGKAGLSKTPRPVRMFVTDADFVRIEKTLFVKKNAKGEIIDSLLARTAAEAGSGFEELTYVPYDVMHDYAFDTSINKANRDLIKEIYEFDTEGVSTWTKLSNFDITQTGMYKHVYNPLKEGGKLKKLFQRISPTHMLEKTPIDADSALALKLSVLNMAADLNVGDDFHKHVVMPIIESKQSVKESIMKKFKLTSASEIKQSHIISFVNDMPDGGMWLLPKESVYNVDRVIINEMQNNFDEYLISPTTVKRNIFEQVKELDNFGDISESQFDEIYNNLATKLDDATIVSDVPGIVYVDKLGFETVGNEDFFRRITARLKDNPTDPEAIKELGIMLGFLTQDIDTLPTTLPRQYASQEIGKMIYIDGTAMVNPNSWVLKQFVGEAMTEYCEGNSICLYDHVTESEDPHYMSEEADNYFVRVWRPVNSLAQYGSPQIALMHVPEHPRFYVVSPCFAKAKIWKTNEVIEGENTIFISMEKCDAGGASNYCFADESLVNRYAAIWAISDYTDVALSLVSMGTFKIGGKVVEITAKESLKTFAGKTIDLDVVTIGQSLVEAAISWPGYPFEDMTFEKMKAGTDTCTYGKFQEEMKKLTGDD
ncbi:MAG: hypothetical protein KJ906_00245 [Nanoarchaeota archaeon]|nr:hypothetical protein [Nanoarchaeota archaeon]